MLKVVSIYLKLAKVGMVPHYRRASRRFAGGPEGYGNVHHLALRVADEEALRFWIEKINRLEFPNSGFVERFTLNLNISWRQHMFYLNWQPMVLDFRG